MIEIINKIKGFFNKIDYYYSPDVMPLVNFVKFLETNDKKYFTKQLIYNKNVDNVIVDFFKEYERITKDEKIIDRLNKMSEIIYLTTKYNTVTFLVETAMNFSKHMGIEQFKEIISCIEKWDYRIDYNSDIFEQLEKIKNRVNGILTKIEMLNSEIEVEDKKEAININSSLIDISRLLELKYPLKANELTVLEWLEYRNQAEVELKERKKAS